MDQAISIDRQDISVVLPRIRVFDADRIITGDLHGETELFAVVGANAAPGFLVSNHLLKLLLLFPDALPLRFL